MRGRRRRWPAALGARRRSPAGLMEGFAGAIAVRGWEGGGDGLGVVAGATNWPYRPWNLGIPVVGAGGRGREGPVEWSAEDGSAPWRSGRGGTPSPRVGYGAAAGAPPAVGGRLSTSASREEI